MTNSILNEWCTVTLGDIVDYGKAEKCRLEDVISSTWVLELEDIQKESSKLLKRVDAVERPFKSTKNRFKSGDVLYGKLRPYLDKVIIADQDGVATTEIIPIDASPYVDNRYLFYWLKGDKFLSYVNEVSYGVNMPRLGTKDGKAAPFVLPPLAEQKIIAEKLDKLLAKVDSIKARLDAVPDTLKRFRQSVLAAAVSGKLTEEWRSQFNYSIELEEIIEHRRNLTKQGVIKSSKQDMPLPFDEELPEAPKGWKWTRMINICSLITDGKHGNCKDEVDSGYYFLSAKDVSNKKLNYKNARQINRKEFEEVHQRTNLESGDICIVNTGATVGKYAIAEDNEFTKKTTFQKSVAVVKVIDEYVSNKFVAYYFEDATLRLLKASSGSAVNNLLLGTMKQLTIALPPREEQTEIVHRVEKLFAYADKVEAEVSAAQGRVNKLTQSILAKAFRGELTAKWREQNPELISGDNSAEALLAKIKAEREKLKPAKKAKSGKTARKAKS